MTSIGPIGSSFELPEVKSRALRPDPAMFRGLRISSSGLSAQRLRMEVASANLANTETTRTADGGPYQRRIVTMEPSITGGPIAQSTGEDLSINGGVRVTGIAADTTTRRSRRSTSRATPTPTRTATSSTRTSTPRRNWSR
jgi:flagellar hook-associated protein FlgK